MEYSNLSIGFFLRAKLAGIFQFINMQETWKTRLTSYIENNNLDLKDLSRRVGGSDTFVWDLINRTKSPAFDKVVMVAEKLGLSINWLIYGDEELRDTPIVGYVGGGGDVVNFDDINEEDGLGSVKTPIKHGKLQAVIVKGDSMKPRYLNGSVVAYGAHSPDITSIEGKECIVRRKGGQMLLKRVRKGTRKGLVILDSYNANSMVDVEIEWAAPILWRDMV